MTGRWLRTGRGAIVALTLLAGTAQAHHSAAPYDLTKDFTIAGKVKQFRYTNPHIMIVLETANGEWDIEGGSPNQLSRNGWTRTAVAIGDSVTVKAHPLRVGGNGGFLATITLPGGRMLYN